MLDKVLESYVVKESLRKDSLILAKKVFELLAFNPQIQSYLN